MIQTPQVAKKYNFTFAKGTVWSDIVSYDITVKVDGKVIKTKTAYTSNTYTLNDTSAITNTSQIEVSVSAKKAGGIVVGNGSVSLTGSATDTKTITLETVGATVKIILDYESAYQSIKDEISDWVQSDMTTKIQFIYRQNVNTAIAEYFINGSSFLKPDINLTPRTKSFEYQTTLTGIEIQFQWMNVSFSDARFSTYKRLLLNEGEINDLGTIVINP